MSLRHIPTSIAESSKPHVEATTRISGPWLFLARASLLALFALNVIMYIIGTPVYFAQIYPSNHACFQECLTPANLQALHTLGFSITAYAVYWTAINLLFALTYWAVAAFIFWRKSDDWMALLAAFFLVALGGSFTDIPAALAAVHPAWQVLVTLLSEDAVGFPSLVFFFFLFPNGRFVPRWTSWIAIAFAAMLIASVFFPNTLFNAPKWSVPLIILVPLVVFGSLVYAQVYRYRHVSTHMERQQTKWIVFGAATALLGFLLLGSILPNLVRLFVPLQSVSLLPSTILITSIYLLLMLIPLSLAIAVLRYRLWDIDVLINRTLVYGSLSALLVLVYFGLIFVLQYLLRGIINQNSDAVIVVSTLAIYVLFQPLRQRIQNIIDRRFYRRKYDAARVVATFSSTLRQEVDLDTLHEQLISVVQETMQPARISLWLRPPELDQTYQASWRANPRASSLL